MRLWNKHFFKLNFCILLSLSSLFTTFALHSEDGIRYNPASLNSSIDDQGREKLLLSLAGEWISRCIYTAAKLEIADHLQQGPRSAKELAQLSHSDPNSLYRVLRLLSSVGIFEEEEEGVFANNPTSHLLSKSHPQSLHAITLFYGEDIHSAWSECVDSIKTGVPAFEIAHQQPVFAYFKDHPSNALLFQEAMKAKSKAVIQSALTAYDFGKCQSIYDIGGGYGQFIQAILNQHPHVKGLVFELPEVIEKIPFQNPSLATSQCQLVAGDFFKSIPSGGDVYILKSILHDWNDEDSDRILNNCYQAMAPHSRLLIVETVVLPKHQGVYAKCMDILMLAITGGKERTAASFANMLHRAGFQIEAIYPTSTEFSIIEARKK